MPPKFVDHYTRDDLRANPEYLYVFGDNFARRGRGGQAAECRDEPNAVGILTKKYPSWSPSAYLSDKDIETWIAKNADDIARIEAHLRAGGVVVFPSSGIGTGRAELPKRAPTLYKYICLWIERLEAQYGN